MIEGFELNENNLLVCKFCGTMFNDEIEAKKHVEPKDD
jgi:hypothetical protein